MFNLFKPLFRQSFASSGIYLLIIALSLAISATTALKFSNDQVKQAVTLQAAKMQAADLVLSDNYPIAEQWLKHANNLKLKQSNVTQFGSMASTHDQFVMVNVKAIDSSFPLRGDLKISTSQKLQNDGIWLSKKAQELLKVKVGDQVQLADGQFKVTGIIEHDSNQEIGFSAFSPTVIISQADVAKTNAIQIGSRIEYKLLLSGEPKAIDQYQQFFKAFEEQEKQKIAQQFKQNSRQSTSLTPSSAQMTQNAESDLEGQSNLRLRNANDGNSRLLKPIENLDTFLQLANILTILLCGLAIALTSFSLGILSFIVGIYIFLYAKTLSSYLAIPILMIGLYLAGAHNTSTSYQWLHSIFGDLTYDYSNFFAGILIVYSILMNPFLSKGLDHPILVWLGNLSFSIYLLHLLMLYLVCIPLFNLLSSLHWNYSVSAICAGLSAILVTFVIANFYSKYVDQFAIKVSNKIADRVLN